jgi:SET domain-containing protein
VLTAEELAKRYPPHIHPAYVLQVGNRYIDASKKGGNWTRFVNDSHNSKFDNNCTYNSAGWLITTREIKRGEELFVAYGSGYWESEAAATKAVALREREERAAKRQRTRY